ncbi:hypothetical protein EPI10_007922 [Gossypium australe]|uniref:Uncharacterized protein n=1 Tax=Gossypium australe TaxID=47621 RepID=A0A5B6V3K3_9ROSI|nr:hypothetical protein EPI10_007922 [Gossypium australe]
MRTCPLLSRTTTLDAEAPFLSSKAPSKLILKLLPEFLSPQMLHKTKQKILHFSSDKETTAKELLTEKTPDDSPLQAIKSS